MGKCSFRNDWLLKDDGHKCTVSEWGSKHSDKELFCKVCSCIVNTGNKGFQAILQHAESSKHRKNILFLQETKQLRLTSNPANNVSVSASCSTSNDVSVSASCSNANNVSKACSSIRLYSVKDSATTAELIWVLKCVASNFSAASCAGIGEVFKAMFHEALPQGFSLSRTKMSYLLSDALGPYFKQELIKDMNGVYYSMCFDETTNAAGKKELQITARYWSSNCNRVVNRHLESFFIGKATAKDLFQKLTTALDSAHLSLRNMLMLGSDGPNVNKAVTRLMNEEISLVRHKKLVDIGTCNIHTLHNAFLRGLSQLGEDVSDLIVAVHSHFNDWPSRWEDFTTIQNELQLPNHRFIKHSTTRWLTMENAAERLLQQWDALEKYFLTFIPKKNTKFASSAKYKHIVDLLKDNTMKAEILFVCSSAQIFTKFTGTFQKDEPLIHLVYSEIETVVKILLGRICKSPVTSVDGINDSIFEEMNLLPSKDIACGETIFAALRNAHEKKKLLFLRDVRKHYIACCKYVIEKCFKHGSLLKCFKCLCPNAILSQQSVGDIVMIAKALPFDVAGDRLMDEWRLLQVEQDIEVNENIRIDEYWNQIFMINDVSGYKKYPTITMVVKASLSLSHGNADIERRFSSSSYSLTDVRSSMSERTLNAIMMTKDALQLYNNRPELVPISKDLLVLTRGAYKSYQHYRDEKRKKEKEVRAEQQDRKEKEEECRRRTETEKKKLVEEEEILKQKRIEEDQVHKAAGKLVLEASNRLEEALKNRDFTEVKLAQAMLHGVCRVQEEENVKRQETAVLQKNIDKRKASVITNFFAKKPKM